MTSHDTVLVRPGTGPYTAAQVGQSSSDRVADMVVIDRVGEEADDQLVTPERGEVLERQVHRPGDGPESHNAAQLVQLSLPPAHGRSVANAADPALCSR